MALAPTATRRFCSWKILPREKGLLIMHRRVSPSPRRAASRPATVRAMQRPFVTFGLVLAVHFTALCRVQRWCCRDGDARMLLSLPDHDAATGGLAWSGLANTDHSPSPHHLPPGKPKLDDENSVVVCCAGLLAARCCAICCCPWNAPQIL